MTVKYIDRKTGEVVTENVAGGQYLKWSYETKAGSFFVESIIKRKIFTHLFGWIMETNYSKKRINKFVTDLDIDLSEALYEEIDQYKHFNDFFARKLKPEARPICSDENILVSPADGRIFAYEDIQIDKVIQVKGSYFSLKELIGDDTLALEYEGGICIVVRLAPVDYHRFHFPTEGVPTSSRKIDGHYYSVSPYALRKKAGLYCKNKREVTEFNTKIFEKLLLVEVGATGVGSIIQTYDPDHLVSKGQEKGYFKFGGSTTIMFIKKNMMKVDADIINNTKKDLETKVLMGEPIGRQLL